MLAGLHKIRVGGFVIGIGLLAALLVWLLPARPPQAPPSRLEILLGSLFAGGLALFFRLRYLKTVPIGYGSEPLNFVAFAQKLLDRGFPYIPYAWYAHTLYSYAIAVTMLFVQPPLLAFRVVSAVLSLATLAALFLCLRELQDARAAWIGTALLAISYWHLFVSRNGFHQFLLPLFQLLFLYGLARGIKTRRPAGFVLAAVAMALGLHSHWGFALMPLLWLALVVYLWLFDRAVLRESWKAMALTAALAIALVIPLLVFYARNTAVFSYVLRGFSPKADATGSIPSKVAGHLEFLLWTLSGNPNAKFHAEYAPVADLLLSGSALLGLLVCLRRFRTSLAHAMPVLLFAANVGGLAVTYTNYYYVVATMAAVFCLAALGLHALAAQWQTLGRVPAAILLLLVAAAIVGQAVRNEQEFFGKRIFVEMTNPEGVEGTFYTILDRLMKAPQTRRVFLPRGEPGRDFETGPFQLGRTLPSYHAVVETLPFSASTILFPLSEIGRGRGLEIFLPVSPFAERIAIPQFRRLYPGLELQAVFPPEPYRKQSSRPVVYQLSVPPLQVARYQGLRSGRLPGGKRFGEGFFFAPESGRYQFRPMEGTSPQLRLDGMEDVLFSQPAGASEIQLLERGLHSLRLVGREAPREAGIQWRVESGQWRDLGPSLVHPGENDPLLFAPYLAHPGRSARFFYERSASIRTEVPLVEALLAEDGSVAALTHRSVTLYDHRRRKQLEVALPPGDFRLARIAGRWLVLETNGALYSVEGSHVELSAQLDCQTADVVAGRERILVLCYDARLLSSQGASPAPEGLRDAEGRLLAGPVGLARAPQGVRVLDRLTSELFLYDEKGRLLGRRIFEGLYRDSNLVSDDEGNFYIEPFDAGLKSYSPDGDLLFHPTLHVPQLFVDEDFRPADPRFTNRMRFRGDLAVSVDRQDRQTIYIWKREAAP